jgi:hypothetical protein
MLVLIGIIIVIVIVIVIILNDNFTLARYTNNQKGFFRQNLHPLTGWRFTTKLYLYFTYPSKTSMINDSNRLQSFQTSLFNVVNKNPANPLLFISPQNKDDHSKFHEDSFNQIVFPSPKVYLILNDPQTNWGNFTNYTLLDLTNFSDTDIIDFVTYAAGNIRNSTTRVDNSAIISYYWNL